MSLNAAVTLAIRAVQVGNGDLAQAQVVLQERNVISFQPGVGQGKADTLFSDTRTLAASATENLDMAGVLVDAFGAVIANAKVKAIMVVAHADNVNDVVVGGAASNGFLGPFADATDKVKVPPGGAVCFVHPGLGWAVTAGTGDLLLVANSSSGTGVTYDVVILGGTA